MTTFVELGVREDVLRGLESMGFSMPTPVQRQVIPILLTAQRDLVGLAQTGTGKTAAFGIPLVQRVNISSKQTQALVLCPTRELCIQVARDLTTIGRAVHGLHVVPVYGGASVDEQIRALRRGAHIIVATPGRLHDLMRRRQVDISAIKVVVLDEADEMLQMGFKEELNAILAETPATKNTLLFSATMPKAVASMSRKYMTNPMEITIGRRNGGAENVRHVYYMAQAKDRYPAMRRIADMHPDMYGIIFCRTRQETKNVADKLMRDGYNVDALHGEMSQSQRDFVMNKFRRRNLTMLVATDVAARGLDVNDLSHVIHYNLPDDVASYTHRSGRTGRAGKAGTSVSIIHLREMYKIRAIERNLRRTFEKGRIPSGQEICGAQLFKHIDTVQQVEADHGLIEPFLDEIVAKFATLDRKELIRRFVSVGFQRFFEEYRNAADLNVAARSTPDRPAGKPISSTKRTAHRSPFIRLFVNVGRKDGMHAKLIIGQINQATGYPHVKLGKIEVMNTSTLLEVESRNTDAIRKALQQNQVNGKDVVITVAREQGRPNGGPGRPVHGRPKKKTHASFGSKRGKVSVSSKPGWSSKRPMSATAGIH